MTDFRAILSSLHRPRLLVRAARCGVTDYRRERDLRRLVGTPMAPVRLVPRLIAAEQDLEDDRRAGAASYSVMRHVEILAALMAEVRLLPEPDAGRNGSDACSTP